MKKLLAILFAFALTPSVSNAASVCNGQFMNPITDVCWDCAFPIKMFGQQITSGTGEDYDSNPLSGVNKLICACTIIAGASKTGIPISFWEFTRQVDVTKTPYCLVGLGKQMQVSVNSGMDGGKSRASGDDSRAVFRHMHWYINPLLGLMGAVLDSKCLENKGYDLAYVTELDKTWIDEELARIMTPDAYLFNNMVTQIACGADCVAASAGLTTVSNEFFWCAGCNGALYPLDGWTSAAYSGPQFSSLFTHRLTAKMHRELTQTSAAGPGAMCGAGQIEPIMDKREYKYSMLFPVPQAQPKDNGVTNAGGGSMIQSCCQPFGRTTTIWGAGRELPYTGEDFSYGIFRKRDCCQL